jgi:hypothetical protein
VHRIGQSKQTFVYRFFIQGTVESKIYEHVYQKVHPRHIKRPTTRPLMATYMSLGKGQAISTGRPSANTIFEQ